MVGVGVVKGMAVLVLLVEGVLHQVRAAAVAAVAVAVAAEMVATAVVPVAVAAATTTTAGRCRATAAGTWCRCPCRRANSGGNRAGRAARWMWAPTLLRLVAVVMATGATTVPRWWQAP